MSNVTGAHDPSVRCADTSPRGAQGGIFYNLFFFHAS
jgi:hypothetical protein